MKAKVFFVSISVFLFVVLCSCSMNSNSQPNAETLLYDTYVVDVANDGIVGFVDKSWWTGESYFDPEVSEQRKIAVDGIVYDCVYSRSTMRRWDWSPVHFYWCAEPAAQIEIRSVGQNICSFNPDGQSLEELQLIDEISNPDAYLEKAASEWASEYVNLAEYKMTCRKSTTDFTPGDGIESNVVIYTYRFTRWISGYETSDYLSISFSNKGDFRDYTIGNLECFDGVDLPEIDSKALELSLQTKLDSIYSERFDTYEYEINRQVLTYSPEGDLVIASYLSVLLNGSQTTLIGFVTVIS